MVLQLTTLPLQDIALLLTQTGQAIQALVQPSSSSSDDNTTAPDGTSTLDPDERLATFKTAMSAFMTTLHSVDVRLRRQIWGLEEAGIITLKSVAGTDGPGPAAGAAGGAGIAAPGSKAGVPITTIEPNGVGNMGALDVGWLNSRSSKVERDIESELWAGARTHLEGVVEGRITAGGAGLGLGKVKGAEAEQDSAMEE
jgi:hypothetical protein